MSRERGQNLVEYALLIAFISVAVIAILFLLGPRIAEFFNQVDTETAEVQPS